MRIRANGFDVIICQSITNPLISSGVPTASPPNEFTRHLLQNKTLFEAIQLRKSIRIGSESKLIAKGVEKGVNFSFKGSRSLNASRVVVHGV